MTGKKLNLKQTDLQGFAKMMGIDYQVVQIKVKLVDRIKKECKKRSISQRKLASTIPHLTHDRVSRIFNGQIGHMTVDKMLEILSHLNVKATVSFKKKSAA